MAINLDAVFHCSAAVLAGMRDSGWGRIVNIASTAALKGYAYVSAYCAAKHGVLGLSRALALETARQGITVNAVCPGYTDTQIIRDGIQTIVARTGRSEEEALAEFTRVNPQRRLVQPEEVAATVLWLCGPGSDAITGQAISVSGGEVM
jgi:NAD(P)-dependent dehydrogenase (short-subunit alcohol dehydrogenase family)